MIGIVEKTVNIIRETDFENKTLEEIENVILKIGLNDEGTHQMPSEYQKYFGTGIKMWQYPNQLAKLAKYLHNKEISSYLEIGCRFGGTFIFLNELVKPSQSYACDLIDKSYILTRYEELSNFKYIQCDSKNKKYLLSKLPDQIDLIFIDGDHSYDGIKSDYELAMTLNPKIIIIHDICNQSCTDVVSFWKEHKNAYNHLEFTDQYQTVNGTFLGIGILEINV